MNINEYDISSRYEATVKNSVRITPEGSDVEVRHITLNIPDATFNFVEGQSVGVLVPGPHEFGNEYHMRLYSIASSREGEEGEVNDTALCVRRCFYIDEVSGERYPGIASNYLCDRRPGDKITLAGPYGHQFVMPRDPSSNMLMMGVGTGIAPFRAFVKRIYGEGSNWTGKVRIFYGAQTGMELLYMNDVQNDLGLYYDETTFKAFEALSPRPHVDQPVDLDERLKENGKEVWELLQDPKTYAFVSGLERLSEKLDETISSLAGSEEAWAKQKAELQVQRRWSELYFG